MQRGALDHQQRLSRRMRESWENGRFWVNNAARMSWAFDAVFWSWIDPGYFGKGDSFEDRAQLLEENERKGIEELLGESCRSARHGFCIMGIWGSVKMLNHRWLVARVSWLLRITSFRFRTLG